jgi:hypothetical protein
MTLAVTASACACLLGRVRGRLTHQPFKRMLIPGPHEELPAKREAGRGWLMAHKLSWVAAALVGAIAISAIRPSRADIVYNVNLQVGVAASQEHCCLSRTLHLQFPRANILLIINCE